MSCWTEANVVRNATKNFELSSALNVKMVSAARSLLCSLVLSCAVLYCAVPRRAVAVLLPVLVPVRLFVCLAYHCDFSSVCSCIPRLSAVVGMSAVRSL